MYGKNVIQDNQPTQMLFLTRRSATFKHSVQHSTAVWKHSSSWRWLIGRTVTAWGHAANFTRVTGGQDITFRLELLDAITYHAWCSGRVESHRWVLPLLWRQTHSSHGDNSAVFGNLKLPLTAMSVKEVGHVQCSLSFDSTVRAFRNSTEQV